MGAAAIGGAAAVRASPGVEPRDGQPSTGGGRVEIGKLSIDYRLGPKRSATALSPTDLILKPGEFAAIVGPSGCGKSTLLNAVAGFVAPSTGGVVIDGEDVTRPHPDVGVIFQQFALFPWFSAVGNVEFPLKR